MTVAGIIVIVLSITIFALTLAGFIVGCVCKIVRENKRANCEASMSWSEKRTAVAFDQALSGCSNKLIINNLILPGLYEKRHTTQIDTMIICTKGVFVIETKSWNGKVYGGDNQKEWTVYYKNGEHHQLYNPTWQNNGHASRVKQLIQRDVGLDPKTIRIVPMVVFYDGDILHVNAKNCYSVRQAIHFVQGLGDVMRNDVIDTLKKEFHWYKEHPVCTIEEHSAYVLSLKD